MKNFTFITTFVLLSLFSFAQTCPISLKRNNGNGTCGSLGELRLNYAACPSFAPIIDSVYTNGTNSDVTFSAPDMSKCASKGYISYCVTSGNMPPASVWKIYFHNGSTNYNCIVADNAVAAPLPVTLDKLQATRTGNSVTLNWSTKTEINVNRFEIEKQSGNNFISIGTVIAANKETGSFYTFTDKNNSATEVSIYRIRFIDNDGAFRYSELITAKGSLVANDFTVFPNPSTGNSKVVVAGATDQSTIQVVDNEGRLVKSIAANATNTIELNNLQKGIYLVRLVNQNSGSVVTKKLTVIN